MKWRHSSKKLSALILCWLYLLLVVCCNFLNSASINDRLIWNDITSLKDCDSFYNDWVCAVISSILYCNDGLIWNDVTHLKGCVLWFLWFCMDQWRHVYGEYQWCPLSGEYQLFSKIYQSKIWIINFNSVFFKKRNDDVENYSFLYLFTT